MFKWNFLRFFSCAIDSYPVPCSEKSMLFWLHSSCFFRHGKDPFEGSFHQVEQSQLSWFPLVWNAPLPYRSGPSLPIPLYVSISLVLEGPEPGPALQMCLMAAEKRDHLQPSGQALLDAAQGAAGAQCCLMASLCSLNPRSFCTNPIFSCSAPNLPWSLGLLLPWGRTWQFTLLILMRFLSESEHFYRHSRSPWVAAALLVINHSSQFCIPLSRSLKKCWTSTDPYDTGCPKSLVLLVAALLVQQFTQFSTHLPIHIQNPLGLSVRQKTFLSKIKSISCCVQLHWAHHLINQGYQVG